MCLGDDDDDQVTKGHGEQPRGGEQRLHAGRRLGEGKLQTSDREHDLGGRDDHVLGQQPQHVHRVRLDQSDGSEFPKIAVQVADDRVNSSHSILRTVHEFHLVTINVDLVGVVIDLGVIRKATGTTNHLDFEFLFTM